MLYQKKIEPRCEYCSRATALGDGEAICLKKGVVSAGDHCRAFRYDPLKRTPPRPASLKLDGLKEEDFVL